METHVYNGGEESGNVRCCQNSGTIDGSQDHVDGLPDKQVQIADRASHSSVNVADDGSQRCLCRILGGGIDCIVVRKPTKTRARALLTQLVCKRRNCVGEVGQDDSHRLRGLALDDWASKQPHTRITDMTIMPSILMIGYNSRY